MLRVLLLLLVAGTAPLARAFPDGAPVESCLRGMTPNHSGARATDPRTNPFIVTRRSLGGGVEVTIQAVQAGAVMKGFVVQARDPLTGQNARGHGVWLQVNGVKGLPECAAITHSDRAAKTAVTITWQGREDVAIFATVLQSYSQYWSEVPAVELNSVAGGQAGLLGASLAGGVGAFGGPGTAPQLLSALSRGPLPPTAGGSPFGLQQLGKK